MLKKLDAEPSTVKDVYPPPDKEPVSVLPL
jgi:hypothetical protein